MVATVATRRYRPVIMVAVTSPAALRARNFCVSRILLGSLIVMDVAGEGSTGLRERKKHETRGALSWAATRLAVERGLDNVRVEDIADAVGVSHRTFNNYFSSKAEAIAARHLDRARLIASDLRARPTSEPLWDAVTNAALGQFGAGDRSTPDSRWLTGVRLIVHEPALQGEFFKASAQAQAELAGAIAERTGNDVESTMYPRLMAAAVVAAIQVAMRQWLTSDPPVAAPPLLRDALTQLADGLPEPQPG
jgi:AcrR family transcriptional regulator